jgi:hypothetical protein
MTEQRGDPGLVAEENLAGQAHRLGQQHRSAEVTPFGDVEHVYWDAGSAGLLDALGVGSPTTAASAAPAPAARSAPAATRPPAASAAPAAPG